VAGQHDDGRVDIRYIDEERLDDKKVKPEVPHANTKAFGVELAGVDEIELMVWDYLPFPRASFVATHGRFRVKGGGKSGKEWIGG